MKRTNGRPKVNRTMRRRGLAAAAAGVALAGAVFVGVQSEAFAAPPMALTANATTAPAAPAPMMSTPPNSIGNYNPQNQKGAMFFATVLRGSNEVASSIQPLGGDKAGSGVALVRIQGNQVSYAFTWSGIGTPIMGHIHEGPEGVEGPVVIPFFDTKLPNGQNYVVGTVTVNNPSLLANIKAHPEQFYVNLHTAAFSDGAVRGQLHALPVPVNLEQSIAQSQVHPVSEGDQIYTCTRQPTNGAYTFTQTNVNAMLSGGINHMFVKAGPGGTPEWVAPDKSAVQGKTVDTIPNGTNNIPELALTATQKGAANGVLSSTRAVMRLDTIGGLAPSGTCDPTTQPMTSVPYSADYLFVNGAS
jgi:hypothetical protein